MCAREGECIALKFKRGERVNNSTNLFDARCLTFGVGRAGEKSEQVLFTERDFYYIRDHCWVKKSLYTSRSLALIDHSGYSSLINNLGTVGAVARSLYIFRAIAIVEKNARG